MWTAVWPSPFLMVPASPITTTATLLRQSVVVSPSDRFRGGLSVEEPTCVLGRAIGAALRGSANFENTTRYVRSRSRGALGFRMQLENRVGDAKGKGASGHPAAE